MPWGPRKSGIPDSVEIPAPVRTVTWRALRSQSAISSSLSSAGPGTGVGGYSRRGGPHPTATPRPGDALPAVSGIEVWTIGHSGLVANSIGYYDAATYERQLAYG